MDYNPDNDAEYQAYLQEMWQHEYNYAKSLLFEWQDAVVARDKYWFKPDEDGKAWILLIKPGVRLVPQDVSNLGQKGFIFHFEDNMTPRPFDNDDGKWKVTYMKALVNSYDLLMSSPTHTYFCLHVDKDYDDEIESEDNDVGIAKLSWAPGHPPSYTLP
jgi:hypothetical protein